MRSYSSLVFLLIVLLPTSIAQSEKPPIEAYGELPLVSSAEISPDGSMVALIANIGGESRMMIMNTKGGVKRQVAVEESKARGVSFYSNDYVILRASETTTTYGFRGDYEYSGAFAIGVDKDHIVQLLRKTKNLFPAQSGLGRIVGVAQDGKSVLMPAFIGERYSSPDNNLLHVDLKSGRGTTVKRGTNDTVDWFTDGSGDAFVRERYDNSRNLYRIQLNDNNRWKTIYEVEDAEIPPISIRGVLPDYSGLVFVRSSDAADGFDQLMKLDLNGEISGPILSKENKEIDAVYTDNERRILGVRYSGSLPSYEFLDKKLAASYASLMEKLPESIAYIDSWSEDRTSVLYYVFEPSAGELWLVENEGQEKLDIITTARPDIPTSAIGSIASITYDARDSLTIPAILTTPNDYNIMAETLVPLPLIVMPHGGPSAYDQMGFDWMAQYFASRGYVVLQPNFRGSTGYGKAFLDAGRGEWGGKMQDDITDGVKALATAGYIDPDRVCIVGASYGGYAALAGAVFTPDLYKCVIAIAPVSDVQQMLSDTKRERGKNHWVIDYWEGIMADGDARKSKLKAISPINFADQVQSPILLLHGDDDTVVPIDQSTRMKTALERADKDVTFVKLKGEDHWLSVAETRLQLLQEMDAFVSEHLPVRE